MLINSPHISGSLKVTGNSVMTGSLTVTGQVIAQTLNVQQVTSSIIYSSGSNVFGNSLANTQQFTGSVSVTGSLSVNNTPAVLGSGTTNYVTKFTSAGTVGNSGIFESGSNVGIGTTTLSEKVNIDGNILLRSAGGIKFNRLDNAIFTHLYDAGTFFALDNRNGNGFDFQSAGTSQMRLNSAGNLGISGSITSLSDSDDLSFFAGTTLVDNRARIELYGPTHATLANQTFIRGNQIVFTSDAAATERMRITSNDIRLSRPLFGSEYGFISALAPVHIVQNAYFDGSTWRSYQAGNSIVIQHSTSSTNIFGVGLAVGTGVNSAIAFNYLFNVGTNGNVLIGTTTDAGFKLDVNGTGRFSGDLIVTGIYRDYQGEALLQTNTSAVTSIGSLGAGTPRSLQFLAGNAERMLINSSGHITTPSQPSFRAWYSINSTWTLANNAVFNFNVTEYNIGNCFNTSNGTFTAPVAGVYQFNFYTIVLGNYTNGAISFRKNGGVQTSGYNVHFSPPTADVWSNVVYTTSMYLNQGDYVNMVNSSGLSVNFHGKDWSSFSGYLVG
jgi:hypothetical protein